jgi:alpha-beta hydrolase superfamily lysophospholipase
LSQRGLATSQFDIMRHLHRCHLPVLVICGTAEATGPRASQDIFGAASDPEKKLAWIKGGTHFMTGQEDKQAEVASTIAQWIQDRGLG